MKTFKMTDNGKTYRIAVRCAYQDTIMSESKLRKTVDASMKKQYGANVQYRFWDACGLLGILVGKWIIE